MIYVIRTKYSDCTLLKIGYTGDDNFNTRMNQYKMHNPRCEILYTILKGTEEDENNLHWLFRKFLYKDYGKEWFYEDRTIYKFFNLNKTKLDLDTNLPKHTIQETYSQKESRLQRTITKIVNRWLCLISNSIETLNRNYNNYKFYIKECRGEIGKLIKEESDILSYLSSKYNIPENIQTQIQDFMDSGFNNPPKIINVLKEFDTFKDFPNKMKLLCETDLTDLERGVLLDQLPLTYKNYYETIGPERCKALGYNKTDLEKEYSDLQFDISKLQEEIYKEFQVSIRYSKSETKEKLSQIYSSLGYNKTPKANDLEKYFDIKECRVLNTKTGKRDAGFEIIKIKQEKEGEIQ